MRVSKAEVCVSGGTASRLTAGPYGSNVRRLQLPLRLSGSQVHRRALMLPRTAPEDSNLVSVLMQSRPFVKHLPLRMSVRDVLSSRLVSNLATWYKLKYL